MLPQCPTTVVPTHPPPPMRHEFTWKGISSTPSSRSLCLHRHFGIWPFSWQALYYHPLPQVIWVNYFHILVYSCLNHLISTFEKILILFIPICVIFCRDLHPIWCDTPFNVILPLIFFQLLKRLFNFSKFQILV